MTAFNTPEMASLIAAGSDSDHIVFNDRKVLLSELSPELRQTIVVLNEWQAEAKKLDIELTKTRLAIEQLKLNVVSSLEKVVPPEAAQ